MSNESAYVDTEDLEGTGEDFVLDDDAPIEYGERQVFAPTTPGIYINPYREIRAGKKDPEHLVIREKDGCNFGFLFVLSGGLQRGANGKVFDIRFPHMVYASTRRRPQMDFSTTPPQPALRPDGTPLLVSDINKYLRHVGLDPAGLTLHPMNLVGSLLDAVQSSLTTPVGVKVDWRDVTTKDEDGNYPESTLRTNDFRTGTDARGRPIYSAEVKGFLEDRTSKRGKTYKVFVPNPEGATFRARAFVSEFRALPQAA